MLSEHEAEGGRERRLATIVDQLRPKIWRVCAHFPEEQFVHLLAQMATIQLDFEEPRRVSPRR